MGRFLQIQIYNEEGTAVEYDNAVDTDWGIQTASASLSSQIMDTELHFGKLFSSMFQVTVFGINADLRGRKIVVTVSETDVYNYIVDGHGNRIKDGNGNFIVAADTDDHDYCLFIGKIDSSKKDRGGTYRELIAYDLFYWVRDTNIADFWNDYWTNNETTTIKTFRDALLTYMELPYVSKTLLNDDVVVKNGFSNEVTSLRFQDILRMICELQNCCPHINSEEKVDFVIIDQSKIHDTRHKVEGQNSSWEDFTTEEITGVAVYSTGDELLQVVGEDDNVYSICGNVFLLGMTASELSTICNSLLAELSTITFVPGTFKLVISELDWNLGDTIATEYGIAYILATKFSGSILINEEISCRQQNATLSKDVESYNDELMEGLKMAKMEKTIDSLVIEYANFEEQVATQFEQTSNHIVLKVDSNGNIGKMELGVDPSAEHPVTSFEISADSLHFKANKTLNIETANLEITSTYFSVTSDGQITSTGGTIGGFTIDLSSIKNGEITGISDSSHQGLYLGTDGLRINVVKGLPGALTVYYTLLDDGYVKTSELRSNGADIGYNSAPAAVTTMVANYSGTYQEFMNVTANGNFWCNGTKSRLVDTDDYGNRLLYCYETASPMFGDIGEGRIADDGKCYVWIDPTFAQTIDDINYQVFLQKYGQDDCYVLERKPNYFVVCGTPNSVFGWELKAKQLDFNQHRLEKPLKVEVDVLPRNYSEDALNHLKDIQSEREVI